MIFHTEEQSLEFEMGGMKYKVPAHTNVEIPKKLAFAVEKRGLLLKEGRIEGAATVEGDDYHPKPAPVPFGVEVGEVKRRARAANEDEVIGDGPELDGDDLGDAPGEDPIAKTMSDLKSQGIELPTPAPAPTKKKRW